MKLLFTPFSIVAGLLAGMLGKKLFEQIWGLIDDQEPPESEHREATWGKVIAAAALQGAIFQVTRVIGNRNGAQGWAYLTGSWPGEKRPDPDA